MNQHEPLNQWFVPISNGNPYTVFKICEIFKERPCKIPPPPPPSEFLWSRGDLKPSLLSPRPSLYSLHHSGSQQGDTEADYIRIEPVVWSTVGMGWFAPKTVIRQHLWIFCFWTQRIELDINGNVYSLCLTMLNLTSFIQWTFSQKYMLRPSKLQIKPVFTPHCQITKQSNITCYDKPVSLFGEHIF